MKVKLLILSILLILTSLQSCINNSESNSENNEEEISYNGDEYKLELGNFGVAKLMELKGQNLLSTRRLRNISESTFQDTLITFNPTYFYEKATFVNGSKLSDELEVIDARMVKLDNFDIGTGMIKLSNYNNENERFFLTRISVELRGSNSIEKRSINLYPIMESQEIDVASEIIKRESAWLFDGIENYDKIILSDLEFRSRNKFFKIENPVMVNL